MTKETVVRVRIGLAVATVLLLVGGVPANAQSYPPDFPDATTRTYKTADGAPNALVLFNPVVMVAAVDGLWDMPANLRARFGPGQLTDLSPFDHVGRDHPPTLIQHGVADALVPIATVRAYCDRVVERGGRCDVVEFEDGEHGFFNNDPFYEPTIESMVQFLRSIGWIER